MDLPLLGVTLEDQLAMINEFRPTVMRGYGSQLGSLFRRIAERGLQVECPQAMVYGADRMPPAERRLIEDHFRIPVLSTYQAIEALRIGYQCEERKGFHLFLDDVAIRIVDEDGSRLGARSVRATCCFPTSPIGQPSSSTSGSATW